MAATVGCHGEAGEGACSQSATTILDDLRMPSSCPLELMTTGDLDMVTTGCAQETQGGSAAAGKMGG